MINQLTIAVCCTSLNKQGFCAAGDDGVRNTVWAAAAVLELLQGPHGQVLTISSNICFQYWECGIPWTCLEKYLGVMVSGVRRTRSALVLHSSENA